jgi:nucleolin
MEDGLTPAQQEVIAEPTDAKHTVGADALAEAAVAAEKQDRKPSRPRNENPAPPGKTLYIGNLYYDVTSEQLTKVFSRFGEVESVKIVYDNRGLSRG